MRLYESIDLLGVSPGVPGSGIHLTAGLRAGSTAHLTPSMTTVDLPDQKTGRLGPVECCSDFLPLVPSGTDHPGPPCMLAAFCLSVRPGLQLQPVQ